MARGRMIDKRVGMSKKIGRVSDKAKVLWFMIYPHLDREGRIKFDNLEDLKDEVLTKFKNWPLKKLAQALNELDSIDLLRLYPNESGIAMQFNRFEDFQIGLRKEREAPSKIPPPENSGRYRINLENSGLSLSRSIRKEGKKEERNNQKLNTFFEKWWERYPKKEDKGKAKEKYMHLVKVKKVNPEKLERALTGYIRCLRSKETPIEYVKHAKTFLYAGKEEEGIPGTWEQFLPYADDKYKEKPKL